MERAIESRSPSRLDAPPSPAICTARALRTFLRMHAFKVHLRPTRSRARVPPRHHYARDRSSSCSSRARAFLLFSSTTFAVRGIHPSVRLFSLVLFGLNRHHPPRSTAHRRSIYIAVGRSSVSARGARGNLKRAANRTTTAKEKRNLVLVTALGGEGRETLPAVSARSCWEGSSFGEILLYAGKGSHSLGGGALRRTSWKCGLMEAGRNCRR